jgi:hypothetical protein
MFLLCFIEKKNKNVFVYRRTLVSGRPVITIPVRAKGIRAYKRLSPVFPLPRRSLAHGTSRRDGKRQGDFQLDGF